MHSYTKGQGKSKKYIYSCQVANLDETLTGIDLLNYYHMHSNAVIPFQIYI